MYIIINDVEGDVAALLLNTCREVFKCNIDKKFINPIFSESNIPIPGKQVLIISYDIKTELLQLDKGIIFKSIKDILEGIYLDIKKGIRHIIQLSFRVSDDEILNIRNALISKSDFSTPVTQDLFKACKVL